MADDWNMPKGDLMKGKRGVVMGVANQNSIAWGIATQLAAQGAEIAFTYQGESLERRVRPLVESIGMDTMIPADVTDDASMDAAFAAIKEKWGKIDFLVHSIAFAGKDELQGSMVANTTREGFRLEASTRYAARDLGPQGIRVNAISAGAMRTLSLAGIRGGKSLMGTGRNWSLLKEDTSMEGVAGCALYLLSPLGRSIAGEVIHVDAGFHVVGVPDAGEEE